MLLCVRSLWFFLTGVTIKRFLWLSEETLHVGLLNSVGTIKGHRDSLSPIEGIFCINRLLRLYRARGEILWLEWEVCTIGSHVWTLVPQLVAPFGKVLKPLGAGASLEELSQWVLALSLSSPPLPVLSVLVTMPLLSATMSSLPCLYLSGTVSQQNPFLSSIASVRIFYHSNEKATKTSVLGVLPWDNELKVLAHLSCFNHWRIILLQPNLHHSQISNIVYIET